MKNFIAFILFLSAVATFAQSKPDYLLPYAKGSSYKVLQGWNGPWGHEGHAAFAYDFNMPMRTPVTASRAGKVVLIVDQYIDGNRTPGQENVLVVDHGDHTFSRYYHLTQNGVLVRMGELVAAGDTIALSGNTGASAGPHLHFDVTKDCFKWGCETIPFEFVNSTINPLIAGTGYESR